MFFNSNRKQSRYIKYLLKNHPNCVKFNITKLHLTLKEDINQYQDIHNFIKHINNIEYLQILTHPNERFFYSVHALELSQIISQKCIKLKSIFIQNNVDKFLNILSNNNNNIKSISLINPKFCNILINSLNKPEILYLLIHFRSKLIIPDISVNYILNHLKNLENINTLKIVFPFNILTNNIKSTFFPFINKLISHTSNRLSLKHSSNYIKEITFPEKLNILELSNLSSIRYILENYPIIFYNILIIDYERLLTVMHWDLDTIPFKNNKINEIKITYEKNWRRHNMYPNSDCPNPETCPIEFYNLNIFMQIIVKHPWISKICKYCTLNYKIIYQSNNNVTFPTNIDDKIYKPLLTYTYNTKTTKLKTEKMTKIIVTINCNKL